MPDTAATSSETINPQPSSVWSLVEQAHELRRAGDRAGSLSKFEQAALADPPNLDLQLEIAREFIASGALEDGLSRIAEILERKPDHGWAALEKGLVLQSLSRSDEAFEAFKVALRVLPENLTLIRHAADAALTAENVPAALAFARRAARIAPDNPGTLVQLAQILERFNKTDADGLILAARDVDRFDTGLPQLVAAHAELEQFRATFIADFEAAINAGDLNYLRAAVRAPLDDRLARQVLDLLVAVPVARGQHSAYDEEIADVAAKLGEWDVAIAATTRLIRRSPTSICFRTRKSRLLWLQGQRTRAACELATLAADPPARAAALALALTFAEDTRSWEFAVAFSRHLEALQGEALDLTLQRAIAIAHVEGLSNGVRILDRMDPRWLRSAPRQAVRLHLLRLFGRHDEALKIDFAELAQTDRNCWTEATGLLVETGHRSAAEALLEKAHFRAAQDDALREQRRGEIAESERDYERAGAHYLKAARLFRTSECLASLARCDLLQLNIDAAAENARASLAIGAPAGSVRNLSQSHLGQLIEEFSLDPDVVTGLRAALAAAAPSRLSELKSVLLDAPDQTAPAIEVLLELRRAGILNSSAPRINGRRRAIPMTIIHYWDEDEPPADVRQILQMTTLQSSKWRAEVFNFRSAFEFIQIAHPPNVLKAFVRAATPQTQADVFRLAYLATNGGVWCDADNIILRDLSSLIRTCATFFGYQDVWGAVANDVLGAAPRHPVIVEALARCVEALNRGDHEAPWIRSGPGLLSRAFAKTWALDPEASWILRAQVLERSEALLALSIHHPAAYKRAGTVDKDVIRAFQLVVDAASF